MERLITKYYIRLFLLLLGLVVVVGQVTKGRTAAAARQAAGQATGLAAENWTVAGVQVQQVFKGSTAVK